MTYELTARAVAATAVLALVTTACDDEPDAATHPEPAPGWEFTSRPDLTPPLIDISTNEAETADDDLVFLAPKDDESPMTGLLIVDADGQPVWAHPLEKRAYDLRVQEYRGEPVLTWWRGESRGTGFGAGEFVIMDSSYQEIATVTTDDTEPADFHELTLTDDGTALLIAYPVIEHDLTDVGGPADGYVVDGVVQEVDVATGEVLFTWSALDHIPLIETQVDLEKNEDQDGTQDAPLDYVHVNSVTEDGDSALLISARNTHAVYRTDRTTGEVDWTLGGSASDFEMTGNSYFGWQHDAQRRPDGTITIFDNQSSPPIGDESRGLQLAVDTDAGTATVVNEFLPPDDDRLARSQGNLQVRENGNVFIGWGAEPFYSEYSAEGELLLDARLSGGDNYRAYRLPWVGEPAEPPTLVVQDGAAYVSWNGATEVTSWRFLAGADAASATEVATVERDGFETSTEMPGEPYVAVEALDASGNVIATVQE